MPIPDPLRSPFYESGGLLQACSQCDFAQCGHKSELMECPACGATFKPPLAILFGGSAVVFDGVNFHFHDRTGRSAMVERADNPEIVQFMCRHAADLRNGKVIRDMGPVRRVVKQEPFMRMLWT